MNILYLLPNYNLYGGTPKKTLDLIKHSSNQCYLYVWSEKYAKDFKQSFIDNNATVYDNVGRNIIPHFRSILGIIDKHNIQILQTQFFFGELLAGLIKIFRPKVKVLGAFVGAKSPEGFKHKILKHLYGKFDAFVFISNYVKTERENVYPYLKTANTHVVYNGTQKLALNENDINLKPNGEFLVLCVSGLTKIKNVQVLIDTMCILQKKGYSSIKLLVAGDGPEKDNFMHQIHKNRLEDQIILLGYQKNVGSLLYQADVYAHPCYIEGFGIAVAEAMVAEKPIIVSNAGALPELIKNEDTGLTVYPFNPEAWAKAIIRLKNDKKFAAKLAKKAKAVAEERFSVEQFVCNYNTLYKTLLEH
ncbi:hypothetical protein MHTCC0001_33870 [Flavobacteriaceae bacterium MHTCC 0001]